VDSTFHDFPEAEASGCGPLEPPENNPTCTNPPYPRSYFSSLATMAANRPWLVVDSIAVPSIQHPLPKHPENFYQNLIPIMMLNLKIILNNLFFHLD
jgi:hypothetical protein